jgi:hypothetical protein
MLLQSVGIQPKENMAQPRKPSSTAACRFFKTLANSDDHAAKPTPLNLKQPKGMEIT